jgi:hypothetical protein
VGQLFSQAIVWVILLEEITHFPSKIVADCFFKISERWSGVNNFVLVEIPIST